MSAQLPHNGASLADRLEGACIPAVERVDMLIGICRVLAAAHERGIVHGDLNPENINIAGAGDVCRVELLDSSAAQQVGYLAPEQALGEQADERTDIYALGAVGYELFLGMAPLDGATGADRIAAVTSYPPELPSVLWREIPTALEQVLMKMLAKRPERRPDIAEVLGALYAARAQLLEEPEPFVVGDGERSRSDISFVTVPLESGAEIKARIVRAAPPIDWSSPGLSRWGTVAAIAAMLVVVFGAGLLMLGGGGATDETGGRAEVALAEPITDPGTAHEPAGLVPSIEVQGSTQPRDGYLDVTVNAANAHIVIGTDVVELPFDGGAIEIEPGEHRIEVGADGFVTESQTIVVRAGERVALDVTLEHQAPTATVGKRAAKPAGHVAKPAGEPEVFDADGTIDPFASKPSAATKPPATP